MIDHEKIFDSITNIIVIVILYVLLLALVIGTLRVLFDISIIAVDSRAGFKHIVVSVLNLFIVIEFFKTFADYFKHARVKLTYITDATILIAMREVAVGLYSQAFEYEMLFALSILLLVLGLIRVSAVKYSPADI